MCTVSMVSDHYAQGLLGGGQLVGHLGSNQLQWPPLGTLTASDIADLRALVKDFREAMAAAKVVDKLTGQPDCVDPEKAKLEDRVTALEAELAKIKGAFAP